MTALVVSVSQARAHLPKLVERVPVEVVDVVEVAVRAERGDESGVVRT